MGTHHQLVSNLSGQFEKDGVYKILMGKRTATNGPFNILLTADPLNKPSEISVFPEVITPEPRKEIFISVYCVGPQYFLPAGIPCAQALLLPKDLPQQVPPDLTVT